LHKKREARMNRIKKVNKNNGRLFFIIVPLFIASFFNACGRVGTPGLISSDSDIMGLGKTACDEDLQLVYTTTYHPFLVQNCNSCHSNSHGSSELTSSFKSFMQKGSTLIDYQSTHSHGGNSLGPQLQSSIDAFKPKWNTAQEAYLSCLSSSAPLGISVGLMTKEIIIPGILSTLPPTGQTSSNVWVKASWDLSADLAEGVSSSYLNKFQAILEIESKLMLYSGQVVGYQFRNPKLRLKTNLDTGVEVAGLQIFIDGVLQDQVTTYQDVFAEAKSMTAVPIAEGMGSAIAYYDNMGFNNKISIGITSIKHTTAPAPVVPAPTPTPTPMPAPTPTPMAGVTFTQLISSDPNLGVFSKYCTSCHNGSNAKGGLDLTSFSQASLQANEIKSRMNDTANPMPPSGVVAQSFRDVVDQWITGGKKQ